MTAASGRAYQQRLVVQGCLWYGWRQLIQLGYPPFSRAGGAWPRKNMCGWLPYKAGQLS
jgi:hypothetical protein